MLLSNWQPVHISGNMRNVDNNYLLCLIIFICLLATCLVCLFVCFCCAYLAGLSSMMLKWAAGAICKIEELTSTTGCRGRDSNRGLFSPWASTLPLSYPATCLKNMYRLFSKILFQCFTSETAYYMYIVLGVATCA